METLLNTIVLLCLFGGFLSLWNEIADLVKGAFKKPVLNTEVSKKTLIFIPWGNTLTEDTRKSLEEHYQNIEYIAVKDMKNKLEIWCYENEKLIETLEIA